MEECYNCSLAVLIAISILKAIKIRNFFPKLLIVVIFSLEAGNTCTFLFFISLFYLFIHSFILWLLSTVLRLKVNVG